jgi:hypothetical protein
MLQSAHPNRTEFRTQIPNERYSKNPFGRREDIFSDPGAALAPPHPISATAATQAACAAALAAAAPPPGGAPSSLLSGPSGAAAPAASIPLWPPAAAASSSSNHLPVQPQQAQPLVQTQPPLVQPQPQPPLVHVGSFEYRGGAAQSQELAAVGGNSVGGSVGD